MEAPGPVAKKRRKYIIDPAKYKEEKEEFDRLLARNLIRWQPYRPEADLGVYITRIYCRDQSVFVAFMRIQPRGFLSPKLSSCDSKLVYHLLEGAATFRIGRNKERHMVTRDYITVHPKTTHAIINRDPVRYCYFVLQYIDIEEKKAQEQHELQELPQHQQQQSCRTVALQSLPSQATRRSQRVSTRLAIRNGSPSPDENQELKVNVAIKQEVKQEGLPLARVARRSTRSQQEATNVRT